MSNWLKYLLSFYVLSFGDDNGGGEADLSTMDRGDTVPEDTPPAATPEITKEDEDVILGKDKEATDENKDDEAKKDEAKDEPVIPKARFDEARTKAKEREEALLAKTKELEEQLAKTKLAVDLEAVEAKIGEMTKQHAKLLSDGELDKAAEVFAEIRKLDRQIALTQSAAITEKARAEAREDIKMDSLVEKFENDYPFLNPDKPEVYNADAVEEVLFLRASFEKQGLSRSQALTKAVNYVAKSVAPPPPEAPSRGLRTDREKEATAKKLAAANQQPPDLSDTGVASDKLGGGLDASSVMQMTQEEFAKLPERELARLRGDTM